MAIVFSGNSIALAVGAPLGTMMGAVLSWRTSFLVLAGVAALLGLLAAWLLPDAAESGRGSTPSLQAALKVRGVIAVAVAWPLLVLAHFTLFTYIAPFLLASGLPAGAVSISLSVLGVASLVGIWIAGITTDSQPRRSLLVTVAAVLAVFALLPALGGSWFGAMALMALWGMAFGAIGIYNQAAILRAGGEHKDAANSLTVVTIQLGIAVGASYGAVAFTTLGATMVPLAAAIPVAGALAIIAASRKGGYPAGPGEKTR
jgi:predicted MFS family arabinose efflux permease